MRKAVCFTIVNSVQNKKRFTAQKWFFSLQSGIGFELACFLLFLVKLHGMHEKLILTNRISQFQF
jgi:hypothetical protein